MLKFRTVQELVEEVPPPAIIFAETAGPYLDFCELHDAYGKVYRVDARLVAERRRANDIPKSDENDTLMILRIGEDYLSGKLTEGVWKFEPDELRRVLAEARRKKKLYQKTFRLDYELAKRYKREYRALKRRAIELAKKLPEFGKALKVAKLGGKSLALIVAKLRGRKFSGKRKLLVYAGFHPLSAKKYGDTCPLTGGECTPACRHGKYDHELHGAAMSLAEMAVVNKVEPWYSMYKELKERLKERGYTPRHADRAARVRVAERILAAVARAIGALE